MFERIGKMYYEHDIVLIFYRNTPEKQFQQHFCQHCPGESVDPLWLWSIIYPQSPRRGHYLPHTLIQALDPCFPEVPNGLAASSLAPSMN